MQNTLGKAKLFIGEFGSKSRRLAPLTTVSVGSALEADRLVAALERAAWYGDRAPWETISAALPNAVVLACEQALSSLSPRTSFVIGSEGWPLIVLTSSYFSTTDGEDLRRAASAAYDLSVLALIDNHMDDDGRDPRRRLAFYRVTSVSRKDPKSRSGLRKIGSR